MFSVDHLLPRTTRPERLCDYDNLVYACCQCNALKQEATPVLNPCEEVLGQHLESHSDGSMWALAARGAEQIALCRLNRPRLQEARRMMLELFSMLTASRSEEARVLLLGLCGFPDNLPHIATLRPPAGNTHPEAIVNSYYANASAESSLRRTDRPLAHGHWVTNTLWNSSSGATSADI